MQVRAERAGELAQALTRTGGVHRLASAPAEASPGQVVLFGDVTPTAADEAVTVLEKFDIASEDYVIARLEVVAPSQTSHDRAGAGAGFAWIEVLGDAWANSRPLARYLVLILAAGVIAALGVITANGILIVGAMAVSPDLLPISAVCVGIVARRPRLARRAFLTLVVGLALVTVVAAIVASLLDLTGILPGNYQIGQGGLGNLARTDYSTVLVALAAGVAAMLAFETRASAAVGVAISVTTIPASAYLGVAIGVGEKGAGAVLVLVVNVLLLIISGSLTLAAQRRMALRG